MRLSDDLYQAAGSTWKISLQRLFILLLENMAHRDDLAEDLLFAKMKMDYERSGEKASFERLLDKKNKVTRIGMANKRQQKMLQ